MDNVIKKAQETTETIHQILTSTQAIYNNPEQLKKILEDIENFKTNSQREEDTC